MQIETVLKKFGLEDREVAVYLTALELGPSSVQQIAQQAGIKRTTRGLHLAAIEPELLLEQQHARQQELEKIVPQLKAIARQQAYQPQVYYHTGKQGYFAVCEDTLQKHISEILWLGNAADVYDVIGGEYDGAYYIPTRVKRKIKLRGLLFKGQWSADLQKKDNHALLRETRFLPDDFPFRSSQFIYQDKVAFISSTRELICVVLESKDLAAMERAKFELLWQAVAK